MSMDVDAIIKEALSEDIGTGDMTTEVLLLSEGIGSADVGASIIAKESGILCGIDVARKVFNTLSPTICFESLADGAEVSVNERISQIKGDVRAILAGERVALNFLSHLSGIATLTRRFVNEVKGTGVRLLDTRKTIPLLRELEKYAVRIGGAENHRHGLYDAILIKENHLKIAKSIKDLNIDTPFEIEVKDIDEFKEALNLSNVKRIMLDNLGVDEIRECVRLGKGLVDIEVSGGITLKNVREIAETGVQYISIGAITHSAPALDFSLMVE